MFVSMPGNVDVDYLFVLKFLCRGTGRQPLSPKKATGRQPFLIAHYYCLQRRVFVARRLPPNGFNDNGRGNRWEQENNLFKSNDNFSTRDIRIETPDAK